MSTKKKQTNKTPKSRHVEPYKEVEFETFLELLEEGGSTAHWQDIASAIGVDRDTITSWRRHPKAQAAIAKGIQKSLKNMETYGKRDWRMWREKLKMLGIADVQKQEITGEGGGAVQIVLKVDGYRNPRHVPDDASPDRGDSGSNQIQGPDMAQEM